MYAIDKTDFIALILLALTCACRSEAPRSTGAGGNEFLKCAAGADDGQKEEISLPPLSLIRDGRDLEIKGVDSAVVTLGVLSGLNEPDAKTLANLKSLLEQFKGARVQSILVAGGVGATESDNRVILSELAKAPVPILVNPGAEENFESFRKVMKQLHQASPQLVDMTMVRRVHLLNVSILSLPGYHNPFYLEAGERGCSYDADDLKTLASLSENDRTTLLLSSTPPRGVGPSAVDIGRGNVNIGDPALTETLTRAGVRFGVFGHVHEAGGNATANDGRTPVAAGIWHESMYLQTGAADSIPVALVGGGQTAGIGHIVEVSGNRARYRKLAVR